MIDPTEERIREAVVGVLRGIAPEVDPAAIDPRGDLREQMDIDSVDALNFFIGIRKELGIDVPERDMPRFATLDGCVAYLLAKARAAH